MRLPELRFITLRRTKASWLFLALLATGCAQPISGHPEHTELRIKNLWLKSHVATEVTRSEVNNRTGLFEIDAKIRLDQLEVGRPDGYRIVARTCYFEGSATKPVDASEWSELLAEPGRAMSYSSTSLKPADRCAVEIAYPKEVGLR